MAMADTTEDYIRSLEEKIKGRIRQLEEAKRKLSELLKSVPHEVELMRREIEYRRSKAEPPSFLSFLHLPYLVLDNVVKCLRGREEDLLSLSRASSTVHHMITVDMKQSTLRLTGIQVFGLLVERRYLDKRSLAECARVSEEFGTFSGTAFQMFRRESLRRKNVFPRFYINNVASLEKFEDIVRKKCFPWETFFDISLEFLWNSSGKKETEKDFWKKVEHFLAKYGDYVTQLSITDHHQENPASYQQQLLRKFESNEFQDLPRLDKLSFKETSTGEINHVSTNFHRRTRQKILSLESDSPRSGRSTPFSTFLPQFSTWTVTKTVDSRSASEYDPKPNYFCKSLNEDDPMCGDDHPWKLKELNINMPFESYYRHFLKTCSAAAMAAQRIETLNLMGTICSSNVFAIAANFPSLRKFNVLGETLAGCGGQPKKILCPTVEEVTFPIITKDSYVSPQCLLDIFPSLKRLHFIFYETESVYKRQKVPVRFPLAFKDDPIDIYRSYFYNRSIEKSNLWEATRSLEILSFITFAFQLSTSTNFKLETFRRTPDHGIVSRKEVRLVLVDTQCKESLLTFVEQLGLSNRN